MIHAPNNLKYTLSDNDNTTKLMTQVYDCTVPGDIRAIEVLKMSGVNIKFPTPISLKYAEQNVESMKDELPLWQFKLVVAFIGSLRDKMIRNGLHHDCLLLD